MGRVNRRLFVPVVVALAVAATSVAGGAVPEAARQLVGSLAGHIADLAPGVGVTPPIAPKASPLGRYIVMLKPGAPIAPLVAPDHASQYHAHITGTYTHALNGYTAAMTHQAATALAHNPLVQLVEPDVLVHATGQSVPTGVDRIADPDLPTPSLAHLPIDGVDGDRVDADIAVIDSGVDIHHPDLNLYARADCTSGTCITGTGDDLFGHGTHVAGIAAGIDNGQGAAGVAPGARIWSVRVLDASGSGAISWVIAGVDWVTSHSDAIEAANMSLGCYCPSTLLNTALHNSLLAGITYAVAAGNDHTNASGFVPANSPDVITVSALADYNGRSGGGAPATCSSRGPDDTLANFSNYGSVVEIAAPGACIYSTYMGGTYAYLSGTSMASPHVAGAAALLASQPAYHGHPDLIRSALLSAGNYNWTDNSGDGVQEPLLDVSGFTPVTTGVSVPGAIFVSNVSVLEGATGATTQATFNLSLSSAPGPGQSASVKVATANGTATTANSDYTAVPSTTVSFAAGETTKAVTVNVGGDGAVESNETFYLNLSSPVGAVLADTQGLATIVNDDWLPDISVSNVSVPEGGAGVTTPAVFNLTLSSPAPGPVTVKVATANATATAGSDYTALALTTITFAAGETTKAVPVDVLGDAVPEANETFYLNLSSPVGAVLADTQGLATIVDPTGLPTATVSNVTVLEGNSGTTAAVFTVSISPPAGQASSVNVATASSSATAGVDYTAVPTTVVSFAAGESTKTVSVLVNGDTLAESNETFSLNLSSPVGIVIGDTQGTGTIVNDDVAPDISVSDASVLEGGGGTTTTASFTLTLSAPSAQTVTVMVATANGTATAGSDYVALPSTQVSFAPGATTATLNVTVNGDDVVEPNETFNLNLSSPVGAVLADTQGIGTITGDD
jgi:subtilisin family serine protease